MKTILGVIGTAATAIRNDSAIAAFCTANYSATIKIFVGEDRVNPPVESDAPFVVLAAGLTGYDVGTEAQQRKPAFEVDWAVKNTTQTSSDTGSTITQDGFTNSDALGQLIRSALETVFTGSGGDHFQTAFYSLYGDAPLWLGGMSVTLTFEQGMGEA